MESKEYSWDYVTADLKLTDLESELIFAHLVPSAATTDSAIYEGVDAGGKKIIDFKNAAITGLDFRPAVPVYCRRGIYIDIGTSVSGMFVQWRIIKR